MEHSLEKSQEQADIIKQIALPILGLDVEYCREAVKRMYEDANRYDSAAVLVPNYNPTKSKIMKSKADALSALCDYKEHLLKVDSDQNALEKEIRQSENLEEIFGL